VDIYVLAVRSGVGSRTTSTIVDEKREAVRWHEETKEIQTRIQRLDESTALIA
jgi:peptidoglycan hydrolase CwlO-like protein